MYTKHEIDNGRGLFSDGSATLIYQRGSENNFVTDGKGSIPAPGWHLAGGGKILKSGEVRIEWCDLR